MTQTDHCPAALQETANPHGLIRTIEGSLRPLNPLTHRFSYSPGPGRDL